jgi:hypothetical protein
MTGFSFVSPASAGGNHTPTNTIIPIALSKKIRLIVRPLPVLAQTPSPQVWTGAAANRVWSRRGSDEAVNAPRTERLRAVANVSSALISGTGGRGQMTQPKAADGGSSVQARGPYYTILSHFSMSLRHERLGQNMGTQYGSESRPVTSA